MNKTVLGVILGAAAFAVSTAASAHVDVALGIGVPGVAYAPVQPAYVAPPPVPVAVAYRDNDDWRAREWRQHEWREHERSEHQWRERQWHDRGDWRY
ncbi:hypothetical protein C7401_103313 [Paraburkholderia unamae]|uniref:hypothetical protein n=1 Tax=Paraburkholderia unamae TaxID=219649 RepID=UPI000DC36813|nr:hypothetical protein [Paraburkholderia unamae]RAR66006.1 hypothetical protein C7401_103313 [Paraburkholderia unamae]